ncbi:MAG: hypothetical protein HZC51_00470 [Nitrospirae bacterium]|nr:hypothetical protein [Nitrospirota bacterium]
MKLPGFMYRLLARGPKEGEVKARAAGGAGKVDGPIIVYNMGKVGSRSVYETLAGLGLGVEVYHSHMLYDHDNMAELVKKRFANPAVSLAVIEQGRALKKTVDEDPDRRWSIITLVRDPVAQTVSRFFQGIEQVIPDIRGRADSGAVGADELMDAFSTKFPRQAALTWFERQFETVTGVDVYSRPFPVDKGYDIFRAGRFSVLVVRLEDLDRCAEAAFHEFLGIKGICLKKANVGDEKWYRGLYREFVSRLELPADFLDEMYGSRLARHFYSPAEIAGFRSRWAGRRPGQTGRPHGLPEHPTKGLL